MAIEYYGSFPCKVRKSVSDQELLRMERARSRAQTALQRLASMPGHEDNSQANLTVKIVVLGREGEQVTQASIDDLLREAAPLDELAVSCTGCPANIRHADFGCGGSIHYPISARAEDWLLARLPEDLQSAAGMLLTHAATEFGFDGAVIDAVRDRRDFYAARAAAVREWERAPREKLRVTSSQILQMTFAAGSLQPAHAKLVALFLGFLNDHGFPSEDPDNRPLPEDDPTITELKHFFACAALAGACDVPMMIDA